jgi:hypothetical protein
MEAWPISQSVLLVRVARIRNKRSGLSGQCRLNFDSMSDFAVQRLKGAAGEDVV